MCKLLEVRLEISERCHKHCFYRSKSIRFMSFYKAVKCKKEYLNKTVGSATDNFYIYLSSLGAFLFFFQNNPDDTRK